MMQGSGQAAVQLAEPDRAPASDETIMLAQIPEHPECQNMSERLPMMASLASSAGLPGGSLSMADSEPAPDWPMATVSSAIMHELSHPLAAAMNYMNAARHALERSDLEAASLPCEYLRLASVQMARAGKILRQAWDLMELCEADGRVRDLGSIIEEAVALSALGPLDPALHMQTKIAQEARFTPLDHATHLSRVVARLIQATASTLCGQTSPEILVSAQAHLPQHQVRVTIQGSGLRVQDDAACECLLAPAEHEEFQRALAVCQANLAARGGQISMTTAGANVAVLLVIPIIPPVPDKP